MLLPAVLAFNTNVVAGALNPEAASAFAVTETLEPEVLLDE